MSDAPIFFESPSAFRAWLHEHHAHATALIVGFHKKHTRRPSLTWPESVDQALAYGWIDGVRRSHDATSYTIRFTPRKQRSVWSSVNIRRMAELHAMGLIMPAGAAAFARRDPHRDERYSYEYKAVGLDATTEAVLRKSPKAWRFWKAQRPSYVRIAGNWVMGAKREATRAVRLRTLIDCSARGVWIPPLRDAQPAKSREAARATISAAAAKPAARSKKPAAAQKPAARPKKPAARSKKPAATHTPAVRARRP